MTVVRYDIAGCLEINSSDLGPRGIEVLRREFRLTNPKWQNAMMLGRDKTEEPEFVEYVREMPDGKVHVPREAIDVVRTVLERDGMTLELRDDKRSVGECMWARSVVMRDYQKIGVNELRGAGSGMVVLPPGCGKTRLGIGAISEFCRSTLVMVPTLDLVDQWRSAVAELLGVGAGGVDDANLVVVDTEVSIKNALDRDPEFGRRFGLWIVDECHRTSCKTIQECAGRISAEKRLGLSATPERDDGQGRAVEWTMGPRLLERTVPEMVRLGYLMQVTVEQVETYYLGIRDVWGDSDRAKYRRKLEEGLCRDNSRNAAIVGRTVREANQGHSCLVLTGRKEHVKTIVEGIRFVGGGGVTAEGLTSQSAWNKRAQVVNRFRAGAVKVLVATSLADQGLDIPRLSRVLLAFPYRSKTMTAQRSGRVMRVFEMKTDARVIDFVDSNVPALDSRAKDRKKLYKKLGLTVEQS